MMRTVFFHSGIINGGVELDGIGGIGQQRIIARAGNAVLLIPQPDCRASGMTVNANGMGIDRCPGCLLF
jgi:hypothetical protein